MKNEDPAMGEANLTGMYSKIADMISMPRWFYEEVIRQLDMALSRSSESTSQLRLLDIGCGNGFLLRMISCAFSGGEICGMDFSNTLCRRTLEMISPNGNVVLGTAGRLPFKDHSMDVVTMTEVIEHLQQPSEALNDVYRILRPNGILLLTVPNATAFEPFSKIGERIRIPAFRDRLIPCEHRLKTKQPIDYCYSYEDILRILAESEFEVLHMHGCSYFPYLTEEIPIFKRVYRCTFRPFVDESLSRIGLTRIAYRLMFVLRRS